MVKVVPKWNFVPVMGILEELGFIWEKGRGRDDACSILGITGVAWLSGFLWILLYEQSLRMLVPVWHLK
jgi:hypothetical protein